MRHEISLREISVGTLSKRWLRSLLRRRWFRDALHRGAAPSVEYGDDRSVPMRLGPPPVPSAFGFVDHWARVCNDRHVEVWRGVGARPHSRYLLRGTVHPPLPRSPFFSRVVRSWAFLWPAALLSFVERRHPDLLCPRTNQVWIDDHPFLTVRCTVVRGDQRPGSSVFSALPDPTSSGVPCGGHWFCER
jgi:hypothetical protein